MMMILRLVELEITRPKERYSISIMPQIKNKNKRVYLSNV